MRIAILSFAHLHAEAYAANLRALPNVELIGIADENQARGRYFADLHKLRLFDSYQALLAEKPNGVIICSENANHLPLVQMAAEAGVHVLCEKPLATTLADTQAILEICQKAGVQLMTAFPMRFNTPINEIKKLLDSAALGKIYGCNAANQGSLPQFHQQEDLPFLQRTWFVDKKLAGGGALADHTVHLADLLRWLLKSEVTQVYAETGRILHAAHVDVETSGLIMLTFENGAFASIDCSWSKPSVYPTWGGLKIELVGEKGLATVDAFKQMVSIYSVKTARPHWAYWGSDANQAMIAEFVHAIRDNRPPAVTGHDGYKAGEIMLAAYLSAESHQPVNLPLK